MASDSIPKLYTCNNTVLFPLSCDLISSGKHLRMKKTRYNLPDFYGVSTNPMTKKRPMSDKTALGVQEYEDETNPTSKSARYYPDRETSRTYTEKLTDFKKDKNTGLPTVHRTTWNRMSTKRRPWHDHRHAVKNIETAYRRDTLSRWTTKQRSATTQSGDDIQIPRCETVVETTTTRNAADMLNYDADESRKTISKFCLYASENPQLQGNMGENRREANSSVAWRNGTVRASQTKINDTCELNDVMAKHSPATQSTDMCMLQDTSTIETTHNPVTTRNDHVLQDNYAMRNPDVGRKTSTTPNSRVSRPNEQPRTYERPRNASEKVKGGPEEARRAQDAVRMQHLESLEIKVKDPQYTETQRPADRQTPKHPETRFHKNASNIETHQHTEELRFTYSPQHTDTQRHAESHRPELGARWREDTAGPSTIKRDGSPTHAGSRRLVPETSSCTLTRKRTRGLYSNTSKTEAESNWIATVKACYPYQLKRTHFMPIAVFNRTSSETVEIAGEKITVPVPSTQLSDVRENEAQNRVMQTFQQAFTQEPMTVVFNVVFDNYLNNTNYSTCAEDETTLPQDQMHGRGLTEETSNSARRHSQTQTAPQKKESDTRKNQGNKTSQRQKDKSLKPQMQENTILQRTKSSTEASRRGQINALFRRPRDLEPELQRGKFDMIFINKNHGLIICDIKTVGDTFQVQGQAMTEEKEHEIIRDKVAKALKQLDKEEKVLRYLTSDIDDGLKIRTVLILPNIKRELMLKVLREDRQLEQDFCYRFVAAGNTDAANTDAALNRCLFAENFPPIGLAWQTDDDVINKLQNSWWKLLTDGDDGNSMYDDVYESIVARFCGPATNLHVCTVFQPRADVSILPDAVLETAACFQLPTLTKEQLGILEKTRDAKVYVTGPPGTGKSLMLKLKAMHWARQGHDVFIVDLWPSSETAAHVLFKQIQESLPMPRQRDKVQLIAGKNSNFAAILTAMKNHLQNLAELHRGSTIFVDDIFSQSQTDPDEEMQKESKTEMAEGSSEDLETDGEVEEKAEYDKKTLHDERERCGEPYKDHRPVKARHAPNGKVTGRADISSPIYLILDKVPWMLEQFVEHLDSNYRGKIHIWAASSYSGSRPKSFKEVKLTQSLRRPPVVTREIEKGPAYSTRAMYRYATGDSAVLSSVPPPTDGPPVKRIRHVHLATDVWDCEECGEAVGRFLTEDLLIGKPNVMSKNTTQRRLRFRDVLVSGYVTFSAVQKRPQKSTAETMDVEIQNDQPSGESYFLRGLKKSGVPYDIFRKEDSKKLACTTEDKIQVAEADSVQGLERPVVVVIGTNDVDATRPRYVDPWCDVIGTCVAQLVVVTPTHSFNSQLKLG